MLLVRDLKNLARGLKERFSGRAEHDAAYRHMDAIVQARPLDINIETTNFCPLGCVFCPNHKARRSKEVMGMELFRRICEDFHRIGGGAVGICSMQSDLFSDDLLLERLAELELYRDRFYVHSTTNLVGAAKLSDAQLLTLLKGFSHLEVSIGGLSREEYRAMYGVDAFDAVKRELFRVAALVKEHQLPVTLDLSIRTNRMLRLRLAKYLGHGLLAELRDSYGVYNTRNSFFSWGGLITQKDLPKGALIRRADNSGVREDCIVPWSTLSINTDGRVIGCGCVDWEARHVIGDIREDDIVTVWRSEAAQAFRTSFSGNRIPRLCSDCSQHCSKRQALSRGALAGYRVTDGLHYRL